MEPEAGTRARTAEEPEEPNITMFPCRRQVPKIGRSAQFHQRERVAVDLISAMFKTNSLVAFISHLNLEMHWCIGTQGLKLRLHNMLVSP